MSCVVVVKHTGLDPSKKLTSKEYRLLLSAGFEALSGKTDLRAAVRQYLHGKRIGLKANCLAAKGLATSVELVSALGDMLTEAGIEENDQIVWDRSNRELKEAGFKLNASSFGRRCFGTDASGVGYSQEIYVSGDVNSLVSRIMTDMIDHNISLPVLKDHSLAGLSGSMKNMFGAINNPNKYHGDNCNPFVADVCSLEPIRDKHALTIMDATRVQYHGGPGYMPSYLETYGGVVLSDDPVAADSVSLEILEKIRAANRLPTLGVDGRPVGYLHAAVKRGLGVSSREEIALKVLLANSVGQITEGSLF